jgi:hypothetical protein
MDNELEKKKFRIRLKKVAHSIAGIIGRSIGDQDMWSISPARALLRALQPEHEQPKTVAHSV